MVTVRGDPVLDNFRRTVLEVVGRYGNLALGYPAGPRLSYTRPEEVPIPLHLMVYSITDTARENIGRELGVSFEEDSVYGKMLHKGVKILHNPDSGAQYEFSISLWDTSSSLFSS